MGKRVGLLASQLRELSSETPFLEADGSVQ
jgi:hypothetical protein